MQRTPTSSWPPFRRVRLRGARRREARGHVVRGAQRAVRVAGTRGEGAYERPGREGGQCELRNALRTDRRAARAAELHLRGRRGSTRGHGAADPRRRLRAGALAGSKTRARSRTSLRACLRRSARCSTASPLPASSSRSHVVRFCYIRKQHWCGSDGTRSTVVNCGNTNLPLSRDFKAHTGFEPVLPPNAGDKPNSGSAGQIAPGSDLNPGVGETRRHGYSGVSCSKDASFHPRPLRATQPSGRA
jgi:hypothetical protein